MNTPPMPSGQSVEILIAEDSPTQAQRLQHILEHQGYRVTHAANGRLALEAARRLRPTLIISDVIMPEMDGYELCRRAKSEPALSETPVILVTTLSDPQDVIRGLECRADNFILKPYDESHLLSRVQFVLVNRQMRQAEQAGMGVEIFFNGQKHFITADRLQILNLLLSTYEAAMQRNKELCHAQDALRQTNSDLEMSNHELEAFSFSVSHDLRAPLRHIDGFISILGEQYAATLPPEARRLIARVSAEARQMDRLIDDLLHFSRLGREPLVKQSVNVAELFREVLQELQLERAGRNVDIRLGELPDCQGNRSWLRQVGLNLLSNAFKFTRHRENAVVEIGGRIEGQERIYFVRDNGAGFDMKYASRLFGVFQRLHSSDEFEGTGVGLSIAQRIIARHGGRIWTEAAVNQGATFYFTLPE